MLETARTTLAGLGAQRHSYVHAPASVKEAKKFHRDESSWLGSTSTALPKGLYPAVIAALQKDAPTEYDITSVGQDCRAVNAAQHLQVDFTPEGVMVSPRAEERSGWQWGMRLIGCGYGEAIYPVAEPELVTNGNRLEYRRGDLTEWYFNSPLGLEQGFTLQTPPDGPRARGSLTLELLLSGNLVPILLDEGQALSFIDLNSVPVLGYNHLYVTDARDCALPAHLELVSPRSGSVRCVRVIVNDRDAVYPVTIDPVVQQQAKLTADPAWGAEFGQAIALSGDTALVGAPNGGNVGQGAVIVFLRRGVTWIFQQQLIANDGLSGDGFGGAIAFDGDTVLIAGGGKAYVFVRSGSVWTQQGPAFTSSDFASGDSFGGSLALDGDTALIGVHNKTIAGHTNQGAAYVFVRNGGVWTQQGPAIIASDGAANDQFGVSVALDGDTALIGANVKRIGSNDGAAYVFVRNGDVWTQQQRLSPSDTDYFDFGLSVALDGDTALIGADGTTLTYVDQGAAYVFVRSGGVWTQQQRLIASDAAAGDSFGLPVALDGDTALIGAFEHNVGGHTLQGAAYVFARSGIIWTQQGSSFTGTDSSAYDGFGYIAALSGDTAFVGSRYVNSVYVYLINPDEPSNTGKVYWPLTWAGKPFLANGIDVLHGEKSDEVTDLSLNTPAGPLTFTRTYRQNRLTDTSYTALGLGWIHNHATYLTQDSSTALTLRMPNGGELHFTQASPTTHFVADPGSTAVLDLVSSQYVLTAMDYSTYVFALDSGTKYRLVQRTWPNGEQWDYTYDAPSGTAGKLTAVDDGYLDGSGNPVRQLDFLYDGSGRLQYVGDQTFNTASLSGRYVQFSYTLDGSGNPLLTTVRDVLGQPWTYTYSTTPGQVDFLTMRLSPPVDLTGGGAAATTITLESLTYTLSGTTITQLVTSRGNGQLTTTYDFQPGGLSETHETTAGQVTKHLFNNGVYAGVSDADGHTSSQHMNLVYRPSWQIDANGNPTQLDWSADGGLLQQITDAAQQATRFTYNASPAALVATLDTSVDAQGRTTQYHYDGVTPATLRLPSSIEVLDTDGMRLRRQQFIYDPKGRTQTEQTLDPHDGTVLQEVRRTYYSDGPGVGLLQTLTQHDIWDAANDQTTTYFYDSAGRVVRTKQNATFGSCVASFTLYDAAGNVLASICNYDPPGPGDPMTVAEAVALYDSRLPDQNQVTTYEYDALGRRVLTTTNAGASFAQTTLTVYDALGRVTRTIANYVPDARIPDPAVHSRTAFQHRPNNDQNLVTDTAYDELSLVKNQVDVQNYTTLYGYSNTGRLIKTVRNAN